MSAIKWKNAAGKTWRTKLEQDHPSHGKVVRVPPKMRKAFGSGTMLIPRPRDVDAIMRSVKKGRLITTSEIRKRLARKAGADCACPLTTGIFIRIAAEAAEEDRRAGRARITPYWRTVRDDGGLNEKYPGGAAAQAAKLRKEGISIEAGRGKQPPKVRDFAESLAGS